MQGTVRNLTVVLDCFVDQIGAFALLGNQNSVVTGGNVGAAADLLHHVLHECGLLANRQVLLNYVGIGNGSADDVQLIFGLLDVFAVRIVAHQLLIIFGGFVGLFLLLISDRGAVQHFVSQTKVLVLFQNLFQAVLRAFQARLVVYVSVVVVEAGDLQVVHRQTVLRLA